MKRRTYFLAILLIAVSALWLIIRDRDRKQNRPSFKAEQLLQVPGELREPIDAEPEGPVPAVVFSRSDQGPALSAGKARPTLPQPDHDLPEPGAIPGEFVLSFYNDDDREAFIELARLNGAEIIDSFDFGHCVRVRLRTPEQLEDLLEESPAPVEYGRNHYVFSPKPPEQEPLEPVTDYKGFGSQYLAWLGATGDRSTWGSGILVAVLDSGIARHACLSEKNISRQNLVDGETSGMEEYGGHGTAVASIIAGTSEDLPGIAPGSSLLSLRVLPPEGTGDTFTLAEGIVEAVNQGAQIINLSLGTYGDCFILRDAVDYALESGVAVVAAAGNDAVEGLVYPAKYEGVLAVSGVDAGAKHLYFANRGPDVDIAAPGIGINTAVPGDSVGQFSGTSAAVPFVSGSLAWLMSEDPGMSASDAAEILCRYSNDVDAPGKDDKTGYGVLDIGRVQDRNKRGIYDVALENPYIHPPAPEDEAVRVVMFAQNRGTEYLDSVELEVEIDQELYKRTFYNVAVGDTMSHEFLLGKEKISQSGNVRIRSSVTIEGDKDTDPGNNSGAWVVVPQHN